jgi:tetratricopeptide (TPR) repeat protein
MEPDRSANETALPSRRLLVCVPFLIAVVSLWVFRPVLLNGFVEWDDHIYLAELARMGRFSWSSLRWMWTSLQPFYLQPVVWMTHLVDYQLWGLNPMGHHATNWLLHGAYVALVGTLVWTLTSTVAAVYDRRNPEEKSTTGAHRAPLQHGFRRAAGGSLKPGERLAISAGIALVCGIHPLQVESVAWVAARNGLLCSVWMVAALCAYVRAVGPSPRRSGFVRAGGDGGDAKRGWWWAAVTLHAVALLTKPVAVSLPLVMLAVDFFPLRRQQGRSVWRLVGEKWLMIVLSAAAAVGAIAAQERLEGLGEYSLGARALVAARGIVFYLWKLVWPAWLSPLYPLTSQISLWSAEFLAPAFFSAVVTVVAVWLRQRAPVLLAAWCSYLALLLPVSGLVQVGGQAVADRYAYLVMAPALLALGGGVLWLWRRGPTALRVSLCVVVGAWLTFLCLRTREQIAVWHDDLSLWGAALSHFPGDPRANYNLAQALLKAGRLAEARVPAERAVACSDPRAPQLPMARATLGVIYLKTHAYQQAVEQLQQAAAADATLWAARYNLACAYARLGRLGEAYDVLRQLLAAQPGYAPLAARDGELAALRNHPDYAARFAALTRAAKN